MAHSLGDRMTPYLALLLGLLLLSACLAGLGLLMQKPGEARPRRPLPMPVHPPSWVAGVAPMVKEGKHHHDDLHGSTVNLEPYRPRPYRDQG